jgi:hypothetical protein
MSTIRRNAEFKAQTIVPDAPSPLMPTETIKALDGALALAFVVAAIAGASGACLVAAHRALRGRSITLLLFLSYAIVGAVLSVAMIAYMSAFLGAQLTFAELIFYAIVAGSAGSATLAATNCPRDSSCAGSASR